MALKKLKVGDPKLDEALEDIYRAIEQLQLVQVIKGHEVDVVFPAGSLTQRVVHKLGRPYVGWFVVDIDTLTDIRREAQTERADVAFSLTAGAAASATIWVY